MKYQISPEREIFQFFIASKGAKMIQEVILSILHMHFTRFYAKKADKNANLSSQKSIFLCHILDKAAIIFENYCT